MARLHPVIQERIFREIKAKILAGEYPPGEKLEVPKLANVHGSSITPVREALFRLVGEGLVQSGSDGRFHIQLFTRPRLCDAYRFNQNLLQLALRLMSGRDPSQLAAFADNSNDDTPGQTVARTFKSIFSGSGNISLAEAGTALNDRLTPIRMIEPTILSNIGEEAANLSRQLLASEFGPLVKGIAAYHRRRIAKSNQLLAELVMRSIV